MPDYFYQYFPKSRIGTLDICELGKKKHHVAAMFDVDVTGIRDKIKSLRKANYRLSFSGWLLKVIAFTLGNHRHVASYLKGARRRVLFDDVHISFLVEKELNGEKVPIPLLIKKADKLNMYEISELIHKSLQEKIHEKNIVLHHNSKRGERIYYNLPGCIRRWIWRFWLQRPNTSFNMMGNVAVSSLGMMGNVNGWFIPISIHPVCLGIGSIKKKPVVINDAVVIREIMNVTVLMDHDVTDGVQMAKFISDFCKNAERGVFL